MTCIVMYTVISLYRQLQQPHRLNNDGGLLDIYQYTLIEQSPDKCDYTLKKHCTQ